MDIKRTGNVDEKWIQIARETAQRTLDFMGCDRSPSLHVARGYLIVPTPAGPRSVGSGYNPKTQEVLASVQWVREQAARLPPLLKHDTAEEVMRFCIGHEVCHYVQDIRGHLPPPAASVGLLVTDVARYETLPHEREANIVGIRMAFGILVPGIGGVHIIEYLKRDPKLRGTGFPER